MILISHNSLVLGIVNQLLVVTISRNCPMVYWHRSQIIQPLTLSPYLPKQHYLGAVWTASAEVEKKEVGELSPTLGKPTDIPLAVSLSIKSEKMGNSRKGNKHLWNRWGFPCTGRSEHFYLRCVLFFLMIPSEFIHVVFKNSEFKPAEVIYNKAVHLRV